ncbi:MAG TPA: hypothetical protein VMR75_03630 [Candidatus Saccharimonadales bacterium]|nr:hypothetical protein [Candidatus Saccharimonadales bacterium]
MLRLVPNFIPVGEVALSTMSVVNRLLFKPVLLTPQHDSSPVVIKVFRESTTGMALGVADSGDVRPLMLVEEPPLLNLGSRVVAGASPRRLKEVRRRLALDAPPLTDSQPLGVALEAPAADEYAEMDQAETDVFYDQSHNGNGRLSRNGADRALVTTHD